MAVMTPCREWPGTIGQDGYGKLKVNGRTWRAHRWVWTQANGPIPDGLCVCHHCDNPPCVELEHLWLGTHADNVADRDAKGRHWTPGPYTPKEQRGEANAMAKLTTSQVAAIRAELAAASPWDGTQVRLARQYGVSKATITFIKQGRIWR